jgi:general stress protein 26
MDREKGSSMATDLQKLYLSYLEKFFVMTLATADRTGQPHASPVLFVHDEAGNLYFGASAETRKVQNLKENDSISAAMAEAQGKIGIQFSGFVEELAEAGASKIRDQLRARHPDAVDFYENSSIVYFRIKPEEIHLLDFSWGIDFRKQVLP